ncbi:adenosylcobinamide-GDP ribazoletransferase [Geobacter pickeringii]|uniref:Adenosylcobinamide-GDP ribazoletransferase n=1 Tax=Geobacter pickeringii TaxID=345632 RepID=A0A0B5BCY6_9BACT|nr:adenosylcobinamide-GDP ribazoletransferase [Geobacter pickeringii]AJE02415.1 cobalamin synthase [Geobacter pickeringii]
MRLYLIAIQFLTIIPLPLRLRWEEHDLGRSMAVFPLAGLTIGGMLAAGDALLAPYLPRPVADLLLVALLAGVTGALHHDGLADVCDGLAARGGRERFLAVMKDSRVGAVGVVGLVVGLLLKYEAILALPPEVKRQALLFFPVVARFAQVQMTVGSQRARSDGLGAACIAGAGIPQFVAAYALTLAAAYFLFGTRGIACCLVLYLFTWGIRRWAHHRLGGVTGDVIGCASELNEIFALLIIVGMFHGVTV